MCLNRPQCRRNDRHSSPYNMALYLLPRLLPNVPSVGNPSNSSSSSSNPRSVFLAVPAILKENLYSLKQGRHIWYTTCTVIFFLPPEAAGRLWSFSREFVQIERSALQAVILHECQNYLGGGGRFGRKREKYFSRPLPL